jgi:hypothetical protein
MRAKDGPEVDATREIEDGFVSTGRTSVVGRRGRSSRTPAHCATRRRSTNTRPTTASSAPRSRLKPRTRSSPASLSHIDAAPGQGPIAVVPSRGWYPGPATRAFARARARGRGRRSDGVRARWPPNPCVRRGYPRRGPVPFSKEDGLLARRSRASQSRELPRLSRLGARVHPARSGLVCRRSLLAGSSRVASARRLVLVPPAWRGREEPLSPRPWSVLRAAGLRFTIFACERTISRRLCSSAFALGGARA